MFWDKLIKKKEKCTNVTNNFSINNFDYDKLTDNEKEYVNKLINEYISYFDSENDISKLDIDIINEIKMYQDLALNIMYTDHLGNIIRSIIDSKKLAYYSHKIDELNNELKYRYFALNRLRKDKKYLAKYMGLYVLGINKINVIRFLDNQINIINNLLVITNKNIYDYNSFVLANISNMNKVDIHDELKELFEQVKDDYQNLFNVEPNFDLDLSIVDKIVYLELFIDKFIYENKDLIVKLKEKLDIISNSEIKDKEEQKDIIDNLMKIKMFYIIYDRQGRNKISKEEFEELYQIIFNVYTYFADGEEFKKYYLNQTRKCDDMYKKDELLIYDRIINYKLDLLRLKKSTIFNNNNFNSTILNILFEMLDINKKTQDRNLVKNLTLLLSLDYENGFDMYFDNVNPEKYLFESQYIEYNKMYKKREFYKYMLGMIDKRETIEQLPLGHADELQLFYYLYYDKLDYKVLPNLISEYDLSKYKRYINTCEERTIYIPEGTKSMMLNVYDIKMTGIKLNESVSNLTLYVDNLNYHNQVCRPSIHIYLPNKLISINVDLLDENNYLEENEDSLLDLIGIFLSNILDTIVLPTNLYLKNTEEIENYLKEIFLGVYNYLLKIIIDNNISINYENLFHLFFSILQNVNIYSGNYRGETLMSISQMIDFFDNKKYYKEVFRNRDISEDINQNINSIKDVDKIVYRAYINAIKYVTSVIKKEKYFHYDNNINNKNSKNLKKYFYN